LDRSELSDLERILLRDTWIPDLPGVSNSWFFNDHHARVTAILEDAAQLAATGVSRPKFVFVHVPAPHSPMAFGTDGGPAPLPSRRYAANTAQGFGLSEAAYRLAYRASIQELNRRVLAQITQIRGGSSDSVVIVMSDHGYDGELSTSREWKLNNFFAASTPGRPGILDDATPVNVLQIILNTYASAGLGTTLPDRYFSATSVDGITTLSEVESPP
jgi:hypothetical protein